VHPNKEVLVLTAPLSSPVRLTAKEAIDRARELVPECRHVSNPRAGQVLREIIVDGGLGTIRKERARFVRTTDPESPVNCTVYDMRTGVDVDTIALELGRQLADSRRRRRRTVTKRRSADDRSVGS